MIKRLLTLLLALVLSLGAFTACGGEEEDFGDRTVLRVGIFAGGWGIDWLQSVADDFEKDYPQYKILIDGDKKYSGNQLRGIIDTCRQDLFVGGIYLNDFVSQDKLMDISDIYTTPLNQLVSVSNDTMTIKEKVWPDLVEFEGNCAGHEGKYYAVPFGGGVYSLNYDVDLFDTSYLYIKEGTSGKSIVWLNEAGQDENGNQFTLCVGQDGKAGTYDDGLPVTYDDFKALLTRMKRKSITPFIWSSESGYCNNFLYSVYASYEGKDNFNLLKTMDGEYTFEGDATPTAITKDNAYLLQGMTGKRVALEFCNDIVKDTTNFYEDSGKLSLDFLAAQTQYLLSAEKAKKGAGNRIAFLIDGAHWYHEASATLESMASLSPEYKDRRFGIMPFPQFEGSPATKPTYFASSFNGQICIRKNAEQPEAARLFLAYLHTDEAIRRCTEYSGMVRTLKYQQDPDLTKMPYYYQSLWNSYGAADIVYNTTNNPYVLRNEYFFESDWLWTCITPDGKTLSNPFKDFRDKTKDVTTKEYFNALKNTFTYDYWKKNVLDKVDA